MTDQKVYIKPIARITVDAVARIHFDCDAANFQRHPIDKVKREEFQKSFGFRKILNKLNKTSK